jgi:sigma-B regulation protein RsbU (phosphoserine phosphatase)
MALSRSLIRSGVIGAQSPAAGLQRANEWILKDSTSGLFVTVFYAVLDPAAQTLTYVNCGHNPGLLVDMEGGAARWLSGRGIALGMIEEIQLEEHIVDLPRGCSVLLYTDGLTEARGTDDSFFGKDRLRDEVVRLAAAPVQDLIDGVLQSVRRFTGECPQADDITVVAFQSEP